MKITSFDQLPEAVSTLNRKIDTLLEILQGSTLPEKNQHELIGAVEAADFLGIALPTLYTKTSKGELPFLKPSGTKRIYFKKQDLVEYLETGRNQMPDQYLAKAGSNVKYPKRKK